MKRPSRIEGAAKNRAALDIDAGRIRLIIEDMAQPTTRWMGVWVPIKVAREMADQLRYLADWLEEHR